MTLRILNTFRPTPPGTEEAVREVLAPEEAGPCVVHLGPSEIHRAWLSVKVVRPDLVTATSLPPEDQRGERLIVRLRAIARPRL